MQADEWGHLDIFRIQCCAKRGSGMCGRAATHVEDQAQPSGGSVLHENQNGFVTHGHKGDGPSW